MNLLSLFSGCGGMDLGFEGDFLCLKKSVNRDMHPDWIAEDRGDWVRLAPAAFRTVFANDIRPDAQKAWVSYFSRRNPRAADLYHLGSIVDLVKAARTGEQVFPEPGTDHAIDIVTGGFPCQDFSLAGKRRGFRSRKSHLGGALTIEEPAEENRGRLYLWMREVIAMTAPKLFVAENVWGLTSLKDAVSIITRDFAMAGNGGYLVVPARVLSAPDYGVSQSRRRVFFFGFRRDALTGDALAALSQNPIPHAYDPYPRPTHGKGRGLAPVVTCADALIGLAEPENASDASQQVCSRAKYMGAHCQGQTEVRLDDVGPTIRSEHHGNIEYRRLSAEHGGRHAEELARGLPERRLTVRECARLQTFPDDYPFILKKTDAYGPLSASDAYKIIGNAVPCLLAYNLGKNIERKWPLYFGEECV